MLNIRLFSKESLDRKSIWLLLFFLYVCMGWTWIDRFGLGDIALDDIAVYQTCTNEERLCSFENSDLCGYTSATTTQYNWIRTTGDDPFLRPAKPAIDHTDGTSNGGYMMVDIISSTGSTDQRARLSSAVVSPNGEQCIEYWYYIDSSILSTSSKLNVFVKSERTNSTSNGYLLSSVNAFSVGSLFLLNDIKMIVYFSNDTINFRPDNGELLNYRFHMVLH